LFSVVLSAQKTHQRRVASHILPATLRTTSYHAFRKHVHSSIDTFLPAKLHPFARSRTTLVHPCDATMNNSIAPKRRIISHRSQLCTTNTLCRDFRNFDGLRELSMPACIPYALAFDIMHGVVSSAGRASLVATYMHSGA
jgi:hypothetical protein